MGVQTHAMPSFPSLWGPYSMLWWATWSQQAWIRFLSLIPRYLPSIYSSATSFSLTFSLPSSGKSIRKGWRLLASSHSYQQNTSTLIDTPLPWWTKMVISSWSSTQVPYQSSAPSYCPSLAIRKDSCGWPKSSVSLSIGVTTASFSFLKCSSSSYWSLTIILKQPHKSSNCHSQWSANRKALPYLSSWAHDCWLFTFQSCAISFHSGSALDHPFCCMPSSRICTIYSIL